MSGQTIAVDVLLGGGCAVTVVSALALLTVRTAYDRVHVVAPATMIAVPLFAAALVVNQGVSPLSIKALLIAAFFWLTSPILSHAMLRTAHLRREPGGGPGARSVHIDR